MSRELKSYRAIATPITLGVNTAGREKKMRGMQNRTKKRECAHPRFMLTTSSNTSVATCRRSYGQRGGEAWSYTRLTLTPTGFFLVTNFIFLPFTQR